MWHIPRSNSALLTQVMKGTATFAKLAAAGALQVSPAPTCNPSYPDSFPWTGSWSEPLYAVSVAGVRPTTCTTWYQAEQACRLAGKRLITNQEWQAAVAGTPDPPAADDGSTECNTMTAGGPVASGSRSKCVSSWGAFDMIGNVWEWTGEWAPLSTGCLGESAGYFQDLQCMVGAADPRLEYDGVCPYCGLAIGVGGVRRGGDWGNGPGAGIFAIEAGWVPGAIDNRIGFRCARPAPVGTRPGPNESSGGTPPTPCGLDALTGQCGGACEGSGDVCAMSPNTNACACVPAPPRSCGRDAGGHCAGDCLNGQTCQFVPGTGSCTCQ